MMRLGSFNNGLNVPGFKVLYEEVLIFQLVLQFFGRVCAWLLDLILAGITYVALVVRAKANFVAEAPQIIGGSNQIHMLSSHGATSVVLVGFLISCVHLRELQAALGTRQTLLEGSSPAILV
jgi:hypothetical protein